MFGWAWGIILETQNLVSKMIKNETVRPPGRVASSHNPSWTSLGPPRLPLAINPAIDASEGREEMCRAVY